MAKKPKPPRTGNCPAGGDHDPVKIRETATEVTHKCSKCPYTETRPKLTRRASAACLLVAVLIFLAGMTPLWYAARVAP